MQLYLVRHTSLAVPNGVCYGQSDVDVAASFADEMQAVRAKLANLPGYALYSSPLQRCAKLAQALAASVVVEDGRLVELDFGDWEMQAWDSIPRTVFDAWAADYAQLSPPNGETFGQMHARAVAFVEEIRTGKAETVVAVTHGGVIRALLAHALHIPLKRLFRFQIDYGSVTQLDLCSDIPRIVYVNR